MALAAIKGDKTLADLAQHYDVHANQITTWRTQLLEGAAGETAGGGAGVAEPDRTCRCWLAHLGRAKWMIERGYRHLLEGAKR